jgi:hypothetical protein
LAGRFATTITGSAQVTERLDDVWLSRDYPVLREATRRVDAGEVLPTTAAVADALGMDHDEVMLAVKALVRCDLVSITRAYGGGATFDDVSGEAYLLTGLHPDGDDAIGGLVDALRQAADRVEDPEERGRLRKIADGMVGVSRDVMTAVLTAWVASRIPG